jgi:hypothetical protein
VEVSLGYRRKFRYQEEGGHRGARNTGLPYRASQLLGRECYRGAPLTLPLLSSCERWEDLTARDHVPAIIEIDL